MKKRMLSLLCVLALCLGLLPTTALAAAPIGQVIYVGNENVTRGGYWTTDSDGNVTAFTGEGTPADNFIYYDASRNTLTLHNATIRMSVSIDTNTLLAGAAIGVLNQYGDGNAELTISLVGTNTIAEVGKGIYVLANSTGGATLTITGDGSLNASASQTGIWVQSNNGNGALFIQNAKVEATGTNTAGYGVNVQSSNSSTAALTVDGGSLTASGSPGILYDSIGSGTVPKTTALTISNSAIVDARGGGIGAGNIWNLSGVSPTDGSVGIVFGHDRSDSKAGTVYGDVTLQEDLEIGEGESLTIGDGASLNTGSHEVIVNGGTLTGGDKIEGTVKYAPAITTESLPGGTVGEPYTETILAATGDASITWSVSNGSLPAGLSLSKDGKITGTPTTEGTSTFTVTATNNIGSDSREFTLKIEKPAFIPVTDLELNKDSLTLQENGSDTLIATVKPDDATNRGVTWESSDTSIATVSEDGTVTAISAGNATITATAADSSGVSATCTVTVTQSTYSISADTTALNFGSVYTDYTQPAAQTVTITNTGNQPLTLDLPASTNSFEVGNLSKTPLAPGEKATFTVQPKAGLAVGSYKESINISGSNGNHTVSTSVDATFAVVDINDTSVDNKLTVTSGISDNITYYTCPSCGYHNWTATDAGYRCDNCGYLESTRQLSGYGNVKGTYTPGSGATSTAASTIPQTGDESNPVLWTVLLLVSGLALGGLAIAKRKKQQ